jgi:hypothetical protein
MNLIVEEIKTQYGVVQPGQDVVFLTTSSHWPYMNKGRYIGYIMSGSDKRAKVEYQHTKLVFFFKDTGEQVTYNGWSHTNPRYEKENMEYRKHTFVRTATLILNRMIPV